jgi:hypothetical protein
MILFAIIIVIIINKEFINLIVVQPIKTQHHQKHKVIITHFYFPFISNSRKSKERSQTKFILLKIGSSLTNNNNNNNSK